MLNEVTNILTVIGDSTEVDEVFDTLIADEESFNVTFSQFIVDENSDSLISNKLSFLSGDTTPFEAMLRLSKLFPNVKLKIEFADEDLGVNVGVYFLVNGEKVDEHIPEPLSNEAMSMAMDITGDYYYVEGFLENILEGEMDEEFPKMCIELAYDKRKLNDNIPTFILNQFEAWAVRDEEYEFAREVKNLIDKEI